MKCGCVTGSSQQLEKSSQNLTASQVGGGHWGRGRGNGVSHKTRTTPACRLLGIEESQMKIWLCNRKFTTVREVLTKPLTSSQVGGGHWGRGEGTWGQSKDKNITTACRLLGIDESQMRMWLCNRKITTVGEVLTKPHIASQVSGATGVGGGDRGSEQRQEHHHCL